MTRGKEDFVTLSSGLIKMYICGPTVYDYCHLGHGRAYVAFDIIYRYLKYKGYKVIYVRNITDIDDKIIARANETGTVSLTLIEKAAELADRYTNEFFKDMEALNVLKPDYEPRATEYIPKMIKMIEGLIAKKYAYASGSDVYYDMNKFSDYGILSGRDKDSLLAGARVKPDPKKRNPLDFALWKEAKLDEPWWQSPWGKGRPGWHIECSAMSLDILGEEFDIHGGGQDLIFPHHENEIAQSYGWTGKQPVRYWIHNGFVTINREKMSKSLGNFFTLREIFKKYRPQAVRLFLLTQHYRSPIDFSDKLLADSATALTRIEDCLLRAEEFLGKAKQQIDNNKLQQLRKEFTDVMDDDFNAPQALAIVFDLIRQINSDLEGQNSQVAVYIIAVKEFLGVLGVEYVLPLTIKVSKDETVEIEEQALEKYFSAKTLTKDDVALLMKCRLYFKKAKQWSLADQIRDHLVELGYPLRDNASGTECVYHKNTKS